MPKGSMLDLFFIVVMLFALGLVFIIGYYIKEQMYPAVKQHLGSEAVSVMEKVEGSMPTWDYIFLFTTIGLGISTILFAFMIRTHPAFFFFSLIALTFVLMIAPIFSNAFRDIVTTQQFSSISENFPFMLEIFSRYPTWILAIGFLILIAMYAKFKSGGENE